MTTKPYAIRVGAMFNGVRSSGPATVFVDGHRVTGIEHPGRSISEDITVTDFGPESFLLPGLIDAHVHFAFDARDNAVQSLIDSDDATVFAGMRVAARTALAAGITTVRDCGDRSFLAVRLAAETAVQPLSGPEVLAAGPPLTTPGGHCHFLGGEVEGADALRAAVRERSLRGCSVVKIMASGGHITPGSASTHRQYSAADLRVVVDEAHRLGLRVAAHAHALGSIRDAVTAGVDTIEHASFQTSAGITADEELFDDIAASGVYISSTLGTPTDRLASMPAKMRGQLHTLRSLHRELHWRGARLIVGCDTGIGAFKPHDSLPYAVAELAGLGLSPTQALAAVTSVAAQACGVGERKGRIAVGADADLLVLRADPRPDPTRMLDVEAVFRLGSRVR